MSSISTTFTCPSCCNPPAVLKCRTRGGTASLIGVSEYTSPSTPPKKYRTETVSGSFFQCDADPTLPGQTPASCAGPKITVSHRDYSGAGSYNALTGVLTNNQLDAFYKTANSIVQSCASAGAFQNNETFGFPFSPRGGVSCSGANGAPPSSLTPTAASYTYCGNCVSQSSTDYRVCSGTVSTALTDQDLESDAITRLLAGGGGTWSSYTTVGNGSGGTCINSTCCLAKYEQRTTLFTFAYQEAGVRVQQTGLTPSTSYHAYVELYRRPYGSGSFTHYSTLVLTATTDGSGNFTVDGTVTNTEGYETYAASATVGP